MDGTKMKEYLEQEIADSLEFEEVLSLDESGSLIVKKVY